LCHASCKSKVPRQDNIFFFQTAKQASAAGFRPCKRCRSDLLDYQPVKEIAEKVKTLIENMFHVKEELGGELRQVGLSQHRIPKSSKNNMVSLRRDILMNCV
jgi:AraC family transcriptional regulator of adaptative response / methylphosphotriester-DNA alkyltransferase methyltransferase